MWHKALVGFLWWSLALGLSCLAFFGVGVLWRSRLAYPYIFKRCSGGPSPLRSRRVPQVRGLRDSRLPLSSLRILRTERKTSVRRAENYIR